jgi:crotonobetaine/carnitine-CoA ligase
LSGTSGPVTAFQAHERVLPTLLQRQSERYADVLLHACGDGRWTYRALRDVAAGYAGTLAQAGLKRGDRAAILSSNRPQFIPVFLGCGWAGIVSVPINVAARGFQLQHILSNSGARLLVIEAESLGALDGLDFAALSLERIWVIGEAARPDRLPQAVAFTALPPPGEPVPPSNFGPDEPLTVLYTSGTTGLSKGVICPHAQFFWWGVYTGRQLGVREGDVLHTPLPLFHTNALNCFFQALLHGATQVVEQRFSVSNFWSAMNTSGATVTYLLGAMVQMLLSRPAEAAETSHRVRVALAPAAPGPASEEFLKRTGVVLLDGFGSTESNAVIASTVEERRPGFAGKLADGFEARIVDENDNPLPDGEAGELVLRASEPFAMASGYLGMPDKTVETWRNLWLHTGDRLVRSEDGYYRFIDRMKDAIRRRGENISSYEVEQVLQAHPDVAIAAVFPVSADLAEDEVMAALVPREGRVLDPVAIVKFCEGRMSYFAIPRFIDVVSDLPRTENGKVKKYALRERGRTGGTWDRERAGIVLRR